MASQEIKVPDIGDFDDVPVIEVLVSAGDTVEVEQPLVTLESDKASMEVPSPVAGKITEVLVAEGDKVSEGTVIARVEASEGGGSEDEAEAPKKEEKKEAAPKKAETPKKEAAPKKEEAPAASGAGLEPAPDDVKSKADMHAQVLVLGAGPGGYTAAFRAADLGQHVILVDSRDALGGVCLNVGCIPSKALLHAAKVITDVEEMKELGLKFGEPEIDIDALRTWKDGVVKRLTGGLGGLAKKRSVTTVQGYGTFEGPHLLKVDTADGEKRISFDSAIIAAGSEPVHLPFFPNDDERVLDSTGALELKDIPKRMLIVGGGIIGLEMAGVYDALGSKITVVELLEGLMTGADKDIVKPFQKRVESRYEKIYLKTKVTACEARDKGLKVTFEDEAGKTWDDTFDKVLVAVGRKPNGKRIGLDSTGVTVDERGFVPVDKQLRTNVGHIFAIGDIVGQPMLAHKATHEGKTAAEVISGQKSYFDARVIPSVAYTDPEVAWVGMTETIAKAEGKAVEKGSFPWAASGRSLGMAREEGFTKVLFDPDTHRIIGGAIVGHSAGDLIAEICLAIEMGADAHDIGLTIHPHPTLSETVAMSAESFAGTITDLYVPKKKKK